MSEPASTPDDTASPSHARRVVEDRIETVQVRRSPKYSVFLLLGAAVGIVVAMILTFAFSGTESESPATGMIYSQGQVFGFLALVCIAVGLVVFGGLALVLDRVVGRRTRSVTVDHEAVHLED